MLTRYSSMHDAVCLVEKPARGVTRRETRDARRETLELRIRAPEMYHRYTTLTVLPQHCFASCKKSTRGSRRTRPFLPNPPFLHERAARLPPLAAPRTRLQ